MNLHPDDFADLIVTTIKKALEGPLVKGRLDAMETKVLDLQGAAFLKFQGVYSDTAAYAPGDCVTRQGALWVCKSMTTGSFNHASWTLAVKKGDGR